MKMLKTLVLPLLFCLAVPAGAAPGGKKAKSEEVTKPSAYDGLQAAKEALKARLKESKSDEILGNQARMPRMVLTESMKQEFAADAPVTYLEGRLDEYVDAGLLISFPVTETTRNIAGLEVPPAKGTPTRVTRWYRLVHPSVLPEAVAKSHEGKQVRLEMKKDTNGMPLVMKLLPAQGPAR